MKDPEVAASQGPSCSTVWKKVQGRSVLEESSYRQWHWITSRSFISHKVREAGSPQQASVSTESKELSQGSLHTSAPEGSAEAPGLLQTESIWADNSVLSVLGEETLVSVHEGIGEII